MPAKNFSRRQSSNSQTEAQIQVWQTVLKELDPDDLDSILPWLKRQGDIPHPANKFGLSIEDRRECCRHAAALFGELTNETVTHFERYLGDVVKNVGGFASMRDAKSLIRESVLGARTKQKENTEVLRDLENAKPRVVYEKKNWETLSDVLGRERIGIRYNTRAERVEWKNKPSDNWKQLTDRAENHLIEVIKSRYAVETTRGTSPLAFGRESWNRCLNALLHEREVDPFKLWLGSLNGWDGVPRIDQMLQDVFGCEDTEINRWCSRVITMGAVARTYQPGRKLDEMVVLVGPRNIGKSTILKSLFPSDLQNQWFSDDLKFNDRSKERAECLLGRVIVEASEMVGSTRAEHEAIKAFVSRTDDGSVRLSYDRRPSDRPRTCILVGTADRKDCLPNDPNLRRFVPVACKQGVNVEKYMDINRDRFWAEALYRVHGDEEVRFPRSMVEDQEVLTDQHRSKDVLVEEAVAEYLKDRKSPVKLGEVMTALDKEFRLRISHSPVDQRRVTNALRHQGWDLRVTRVEGKSVRYWMKYDK